MLWLIIENASHEIVACNTIEREGKYQIWVERANGKSLKVRESENAEEIEEVKDAIDFAIENGHKTLKIK